MCQWFLTVPGSQQHLASVGRGGMGFFTARLCSCCPICRDAFILHLASRWIRVQADWRCSEGQKEAQRTIYEWAAPKKLLAAEAASNLISYISVIYCTTTQQRKYLPFEICSKCHQDQYFICNDILLQMLCILFLEYQDLVFPSSYFSNGISQYTHTRCEHHTGSTKTASQFHPINHSAAFYWSRFLVQMARGRKGQKMKERGVFPPQQTLFLPEWSWLWMAAPRRMKRGGGGGGEQRRGG